MEKSEAGEKSGAVDKSGAVEKPGPMQLERQNSLEREPRTLNLESARMAALSIVNSKSLEEALEIFTKEVETAAKETPKPELELSDSDDDWDDPELDSTDSESSPTTKDLREVVSAPF